MEVGDIVNVLSTHHTPERSVVGVWFEAKEVGGNLVAGDDASEAQFFPLDRPPPEMAFEADKKIIEQLKGSSL